jgi:hypothetical protein
MDGRTQLIGTTSIPLNGKILTTMDLATTHLVTMVINVLVNPVLQTLMAKKVYMKMAAQLQTRTMMEF